MDYLHSTIAFSAMAGTISTSIFFPALPSLQADLNASDQSISLAVSLYIFFQGAAPVAWSAISEIRGRRKPYIISNLLYCGATAGCAVSGDVRVFIACRILQAIGASSVLSLGAGTLADIYDVS